MYACPCATSVEDDTIEGFVCGCVARSDTQWDVVMVDGRGLGSGDLGYLCGGLHLCIRVATMDRDRGALDRSWLGVIDDNRLPNQYLENIEV